jgi:hypothetical protein
MNHDWQFLAASRGSETGSSPVVIAVCSRCGAVRAEDAPTSGEGRIDLAGDCESTQSRFSYGSTPR